MQKPAETVDPEEIAKFSAMAAEWWDPRGKFRPLHKFNPVRLDYIRREVCHFKGLDALSQTPFTGLDLLDIGCGGGLLSEPMCRLGAMLPEPMPAKKTSKPQAFTPPNKIWTLTIRQPPPPCWSMPDAALTLF